MAKDTREEIENILRKDRQLSVEGQANLIEYILKSAKLQLLAEIEEEFEAVKWSSVKMTEKQVRTILATKRGEIEGDNSL